jgi:hypothetical protein
MRASQQTGMIKYFLIGFTQNKKLKFDFLCSSRIVGSFSNIHK